MVVGVGDFRFLRLEAFLEAESNILSIVPGLLEYDGMRNRRFLERRVLREDRIFSKITLIRLWLCFLKDFPRIYISSQRCNALIYHVTIKVYSGVVLSHLTWYYTLNQIVIRCSCSYLTQHPSIRCEHVMHQLDTLHLYLYLGIRGGKRRFLCLLQP